MEQLAADHKGPSSQDRTRSQPPRQPALQEECVESVDENQQQIRRPCAALPMRRAVHAGRGSKTHADILSDGLTQRATSYQVLVDRRSRSPPADTCPRRAAVRPRRPRSRGGRPSQKAAADVREWREESARHHEQSDEPRCEVHQRPRQRPRVATVAVQPHVLPKATSTLDSREHSRATKHAPMATRKREH